MGEQMAIFIDFENVALWAEREFFDFEVTSLMEYLQSRGPAVVKRAYGDWSRFSRYREAMMNNSIDLLQIYSVRAGKNRADIRMAIDAFEIAMTRSQIQTFVIVSGDSDFSPLAAKLREYGRYIIGIGPRSITHDLLVRSCDEFIYLETALGETIDVNEQSCMEIEQARDLLTKALQALGQRGELPVLATHLKQTMLLMDPTFNEANIGYPQFKSWLESNQDLARVFIKDLQLFVATVDFPIPADGEAVPVSPGAETGPAPVRPAAPARPRLAAPGKPPAALPVQYRQVFSRLKLNTVDLNNRREVLRDIYAELVEHPGQYTADDLIRHLQERYEAQGVLRNRLALREIVQMAVRQQAFASGEASISLFTPIWLGEGVTSEADFVERAESDFVYAIVREGLEVDLGELAYLLVSDHNQDEYIQMLLDDLYERGMIVRRNSGYSLPGRGIIHCVEQPALQVLCQDIESVVLPEHQERGVNAAHNLAKKAMVQRSQDFAASSSTYLLACRLQWDAVERGEPGATLDDLRWYMASYASAVAGKLSQVNRDYTAARSYYLAFFALVQEEDPLWARMRGLINPMLAYFWSNTGRELDINVSSWNLNMASPAQIAVFAATHPSPELRKLWYRVTLELAQVNPSVLRRIANQLMMSRADNAENAHVAEQIEEILDVAQAG